MPQRPPLPHFLVCLVLAIVSWLPGSVAAQVTDDFSDGDLDAPGWFGDRENFTVADGRLRLNAEEGGRSTLGVPLRPDAPAPPDSFRLEFFVEMDFAPSTANYAVVYLTPGRTITEGAGDYISLRLGGRSGDQDALTVSGYAAGRESGGVFDGQAGALGGEPAVIRFAVEKLPARPWTVLADYSGGNDLQPVGELADEFDLNVRYLILACNYTRTRARAFSFDELLATFSAPREVEPTVLARRDNLLVTEFMANPNPPVGLPNEEYVELYNAGDTLLLLDGVSLGSGGGPVALSGSIPPREYLLLVDGDAAAEFAGAGVRTQAINLPGLSNAADDISLLRAGDTLVFIDYTTAWYNDPDRDDGGFSIELTSLAGADAGCMGRWRASLDPSGGTPGRPNSTLDDPADVDGPSVESVDTDGSGVTLRFSEPLVTSDPDFLLLDGDTEVATTVVRSADNQRFEIRLTGGLSPGTFYDLVLPPLFDCVGNQSEERTITVGLPDTPGPGDVVINEILFNPTNGGDDFVEVYNRTTNKIFQIEGWQFSNDRSGTNGSTATITATRLLLPGEHLTFTEDAITLPLTFGGVNENLVVENDLPSLPNDAGNLTVTAAGVILDAFDYSADLHSPLLDNVDGVSLERLRPGAPTNGADNWFSAASSAGGGTPTQSNSQDRGEPRPDGTESLSLATPTFSPDGDGFEDLLEVVYRGVPAGSVARVRIYDAQGRRVRTLRDAELLGTAGTIVWDGADDDGLKARVGIHVVLVELITPNGPVETYKLPAVLAGER